jgi:hypothetical protein
LKQVGRQVLLNTYRDHLCLAGPPVFLQKLIFVLLALLWKSPASGQNDAFDPNRALSLISFWHHLWPFLIRCPVAKC